MVNLKVFTTTKFHQPPSWLSSPNFYQSWEFNFIMIAACSLDIKMYTFVVAKHV